MTMPGSDFVLINSHFASWFYDFMLQPRSHSVTANVIQLESLPGLKNCFVMQNHVPMWAPIIKSKPKENIDISWAISMRISI